MYVDKSKALKEKCILCYFKQRNPIMKYSVCVYAQNIQINIRKI